MAVHVVIGEPVDQVKQDEHKREHDARALVDHARLAQTHAPCRPTSGRLAAVGDGSDVVRHLRHLAVVALQTAPRVRLADRREMDLLQARSTRANDVTRSLSDVTQLVTHTHYHAIVTSHARQTCVTYVIRPRNYQNKYVNLVYSLLSIRAAHDLT